MGKWDKFDPIDQQIEAAIFEKDYQGAARIIVHEYLNPVVRYCFIKLGGPETAEDVAHDVFIAAYDAMPKYQTNGAAKFRTWLFTIARNQCKKHLEKYGNRQRLEEKNLGFIEEFVQTWP